MQTLATQPILIGIGMISLLYFIWVIMSAVGLKGVSEAASIKDIRQHAGLSLLGLTVLSLILVLIYHFVFKTPTATPIPS